MLEKASIPKQIKQLSEEKLAQFEIETKCLIEKLLNTQDGWKKESSIESTEIYTRPGMTNALVVLSKGILNCSYLKVNEAYTLVQLDEEAAKIVDKNSPWQVVDLLYGKYYLVYLQLLNICPFISNRYFFLSSNQDLSYKENEYLLWGASLDEPLDFSSYGFENQKFVRGRMPIFAWHLKKINEKQTEVRYLAEANLEGSIPTTFANSGTIQSLGSMIPNYNKYLAKHAPKNTVKFLQKKL